MRLLLFTLFAVAFVGSAFAQTVKLEWINFSPYTEAGQTPGQSNVVPESQITALLDTLQPRVEGIRTFGVLHDLQNVPYLAKQRGLKVMMGIWLGKEDTPAGLASNAQQVATGIAIANAGWADYVIVGSEALYRNDLSAERLIEYIQQVQSACPNVPVSCADVYDQLIAHPEVMDACDFISPNIYPFWAGSSVECAMQQFHTAYEYLLPYADGKEIIISETGWKTAGEPVEQAIPSFENAARYLRELRHWSRAQGVAINLFEAFDEPWKLPNDDGWGIYFSDKTLKPGMETLFLPFETIDSTWICRPTNVASTDTLQVDFMPTMGSFLPIQGRVNRLIPCDYGIATYIKVSGSWWTKPTFAQPVEPVQCDGSWVVDYVTGGQDEWATDICVFLIPVDDFPPVCDGTTLIPPYLFNYAIDWTCEHRTVLIREAFGATGDQVNVFPNPTKGLFWVAIREGNTRNIELTLYDIYGKKIENQYLEDKNSFDLSAFPSGVYRLQCHDKTRGIITVKNMIK